MKNTQALTGLIIFLIAATCDWIARVIPSLAVISQYEYFGATQFLLAMFGYTLIMLAVFKQKED